MKAGIYLGKEAVEIRETEPLLQYLRNHRNCRCGCFEVFWNGQGDGVRSFGLPREAGSRAGL